MIAIQIKSVQSACFFFLPLMSWFALTQNYFPYTSLVLLFYVCITFQYFLDSSASFLFTAILKVRTSISSS